MTDPNTPPMPPVAPAPPPSPPPAPEPPIGAIVDPAAGAPKLVTVPTPDVLAAFPPPPPIGAPVLQPDPQPQFGAYPVAPPSALPSPAPAPTILNPPPPAAAPPKRFHELGERTQAEVKAYWEKKHPGEAFPADDWIEPTGAITELAGGRPIQDSDTVVEVARQPVKVSQRTFDEMNAGKARLQERHVERAAVLRKQAEMRAGQQATGKVAPGNMDYVEPKA